MKLFASIAGGILLICLFGWMVYVWTGKIASYDEPVTEASIKTLLEKRGMKICSETKLELSNTPGYVEGKTATASSHCEQDKNPVVISIMKFDSPASRSAAAQRVATTHRGGFGPNFAYSYGPYVITIQGTRGIGDQILLGRALTEAGAQP